MDVMHDPARLRVLRALRLKGRVRAVDVATAVGLGDDQVAQLLDELIATGNAEEARGWLKLSVSGREHLTGLLEAEKRTIDEQQVLTLYREFDEHNIALKSLMTRWQLKDDETPNDHSDPDYDQVVIDDLVRLDADFQPLLARIVAAAPRLGHYPVRFGTALARIQAGDHTWFAKPLADSYHTVWFELHEDLIGLAGLSRAEEAAAGRAE